jgi:hypothetical protein
VVKGIVFIDHEVFTKLLRTNYCEFRHVCIGCWTNAYLRNLCPPFLLEGTKDADVARLQSVGGVGRQTQNQNPMLLCEAYKRPGAVRIVAVENEKAIVGGVLETYGGCGSKVFLEPQPTQLLIGPSVRGD